MTASNAAGFAGLTVVAFESRRATEMAELIRRHGGVPVVAPSMREVAIEDTSAATAFARALEGGDVDVVILLTGVGTRALVKAVSQDDTGERFASLLRRTTVVARGPKPVAALRELGLAPSITAPEPNTWREIIAELDERGVDLRSRRVAVQEYGVPNTQLADELRRRGAEVLRVPVYNWAFPEDMGPLHAAIRKIADGAADFALFTSGNQVHHLVRAATDLGVAGAVAKAWDRVVVGSIGPVCSEALRDHGFPVDLEPEHPKMGQLVAAAARQGPALLNHKRLAQSPP